MLWPRQPRFDSWCGQLAAALVIAASLLPFAGAAPGSPRRMRLGQAPAQPARRAFFRMLIQFGGCILIHFGNWHGEGEGQIICAMQGLMALHGGGGVAFESSQSKASQPGQQQAGTPSPRQMKIAVRRNQNDKSFMLPELHFRDKHHAFSQRRKGLNNDTEAN